MQDIQQTVTQVFFQLKHMELQPEKVQTSSQIIQIRIKVHTNNSSSYSDYRDCPDRKFIFIIEETEEETPPLSEGEEYTFEQQLSEVGTYNLQCLNYPKIKSKI